MALWPTIDFAHASGREVNYFSGRSKGLGDAMVGVLDDDAALYVNPAGLAGIDTPQISLVPGTLEVSTDFIPLVKDAMSALNNFNLGSLSILTGKNPYLRGQLTPTFLFPGFGMGIYSDVQLSLYSRNLSLPQMRLGHQVTNGFQFGYGFSFGQGGVKRKRKKEAVEPREFRLGIAPKILWRRGGYFELGTNELYRIQEGEALLKEILGSYTLGIGVDLGAQAIFRPHPRIQYVLGTAIRDVGNTKFSGRSQPTLTNWAWGGSIQFKAAPGTTLLASYEYSYFLSSIDYRQKNKIGLEIALPLFKAYANIHQGYFGYGAGIDLGIVRIYAGQYVTDLGSVSGLEIQRRWLLSTNVRLSL